jgi:hypothetical protein
MPDHRAEVEVTLRTRGMHASLVRVMVPAGLNPRIIRYHERLYALGEDGRYIVADVWPVIDALDRARREKEPA